MIAEEEGDLPVLDMDVLNIFCCRSPKLPPTPSVKLSILDLPFSGKAQTCISKFEKVSASAVPGSGMLSCSVLATDAQHYGIGSPSDIPDASTHCIRKS